MKSIAENMERVFDVELSSDVQSLSTVIPNFSYFIAPILNVGNTLQNNSGNVNLKKTKVT